MGYTAQVSCIGNLIKGDLSSHLVLDMSYTTIGEDVSLDLQLSEDFLQFGQNRLDCYCIACELQIVDVLGEHRDESSMFVAHAELGVDLTGLHVALRLCDAT